MSAEPLLRTIFANPDEQTPRLLYADWLDQHGDPGRAELIRIQCLQYYGRPNPEQSRRLTDRAQGLLAEHQDSWLSPAEEVVCKVDIQWRRGFPESVMGPGLTETDLEQLARLPGISRLGLIRARLRDEGLKLLARFPALEHLSLTLTPTTDAGVRHLAGLTQLRSLSLAGTQVTDRGLLRLVQCLSLITLELSEPFVGPPPVTAEGIETAAQALPGLIVTTAEARRGASWGE